MNMENEFLLISGSMFSGKSQYLIENFYEKEDVEAFSPTIDTRDAEITSRKYPDKKISCTKISNPMEMTKSTAGTIILDEFQFLGTKEILVDAVNELKKQNKRIVMTGLDLLANGIEWENYTAMKEICDREIKLRARCQTCGKPARFTSMISGSKNKSVQIEGEDVVYEPRCLSHFEK